ncbi:MAG: hypothetical protein HY362_03330 [Candidatus Aenigmarchaeota archaeon]|nr:hypothetical protein [Candidatus Aenigmarchaeota archaeon]
MELSREFQRPATVKHFIGKDDITGLQDAVRGRYVGITPPLGKPKTGAFAMGRLTGRINSWEGNVDLGLTDGYQIRWKDGKYIIESLASGVKVPETSILYTDSTLYRQNTARFLRGYAIGRRFNEQMEREEFGWTSEKKRVVFLGGVHGVGKGTALSKADTKGLVVKGFSDVMKGLIAGESKDSLNKKSYEERRIMVEGVYNILLDIGSPGVIIDSHFTMPIRDPQGIGVERWEVGLPARYIPYVTDFVVVTADESQVYSRRAGDPAGRRITTRHLISEELANELSGGRAAAGLSGRSLVVVDNNQTPEEAGAQLTEIFASAAD